MSKVHNKKERVYATCDPLDFFSVGAKDRYGILLGVELEYTLPSRCQEINEDIVSFIQNLPNFIVKDDGSLRCGGYEIVSAPLSLIKHKSGSEWYSILSMVDNSDNIDRDRDCGLHIHVNMDSGIDWRKCRALIYSNPTFFFKRYAKRSPNGYAFVTSYIEEPDSSDDDDDFDYEGHDYEDLRYHAVNPRGNEGNTVEFRMFSSTKNMIRLFRSLELVHAFTRYSRDFPLSFNVEPFFKFVENNKNVYPAVYSSFFVNGILSFPAKPEVSLS